MAFSFDAFLTFAVLTSPSELTLIFMYVKCEKLFNYFHLYKLLDVCFYIIVIRYETLLWIYM